MAEIGLLIMQITFPSLLPNNKQLPANMGCTCVGGLLIHPYLLRFFPPKPREVPSTGPCIPAHHSRLEHLASSHPIDFGLLL